MSVHLFPAATKQHAARTCDQLSCCQARTPPCEGCTTLEQHDAPAMEPFDRIAYWVAIAAVTVASVALLSGIAGFLYATYGA